MIGVKKFTKALSLVDSSSDLIVDTCFNYITSVGDLYYFFSLYVYKAKGVSTNHLLINNLSEIT